MLQTSQLYRAYGNVLILNTKHGMRIQHLAGLPVQVSSFSIAVSNGERATVIMERFCSLFPIFEGKGESIRTLAQLLDTKEELDSLSSIHAQFPKPTYIWVKKVATIGGSKKVLSIKPDQMQETLLEVEHELLPDPHADPAKPVPYYACKMRWDPQLTAQMSEVIVSWVRELLEAEANLQISNGMYLSYLHFYNQNSSSQENTEND